MNDIISHSIISVNDIYQSNGFAENPAVVQVRCMQRLRDRRKARGLSQVELAEKVGCSQGTISAIERGTANPTLDLIEALAQALGTTPVSLFGLSETQERALNALERLDPELRESALRVLENMVPAPRQIEEIPKAALGKAR